MNRPALVMVVAIGGVLALAACSKHHATPNRATAPGRASVARAMPAGTATLPHLAWIAQLQPLNADVTRTPISGHAQFGVNNGMLTIRIDVAGAPPGMAHAQHIHGFLNGHASGCPTKTADANGNGILSLSEAETVTGPPLIPLNADPLSMNFTSLTYPTASANGTYTYRETISLSALQAAFAKAHNGQKLDLAKDSVMIHGVSARAGLPATAPSSGAASAGTVAAGTSMAAAGMSAAAGTAGRSAPATVRMPAALPIACGKITPVKQTH